MGKNKIFKALALAMLMPAMLLTTACSTSDDDSIINNENTDKKGYALPVTVNVTREGDAATTRATYTDNGDGTGSLSFSEGDQLFVKGEDVTSTQGVGAGEFAGTLNYVSEGTFSGTIYTENEYSGTAADLLKKDDEVVALLLPNGYESYRLFSIGSGYSASFTANPNYTFAPTKAIGVEQFSFEMATGYSDGFFALSPLCAILNFTITGLTASTPVAVALTGLGLNITGTVTPDESGTATFATGVIAGFDLSNFSLIVDDNPITLGSHALAAGKIYNITRNAALAAVTASDLGKVIGADGKIYADATAATNAGTTAVAMIAYVGSQSNCTHGLAIALNDVEIGGSTHCTWDDASGYINDWASHNPVSGGTWRLPSVDDIQYMLIGCGSSDSHTDMPVAYDGDVYFSETVHFDSSGLRSKLAIAATNNLDGNAAYWTDTDFTWYYWLVLDDEPEAIQQAWAYHFGDSVDNFEPWDVCDNENVVRACLAF